MSRSVYTVRGVPNKRGKDQKMLTFWLPEADWEAARQAVAKLNESRPEGTAEVTVASECRKALRAAVKRAEKLPD